MESLKDDVCCAKSNQGKYNKGISISLFHGEKEHPDWLPERSAFYYTDG